VEHVFLKVLELPLTHRLQPYLQ